VTSDIFTKNCSGVLFDKHIQKFVGYDKYMEEHGVVSESNKTSIDERHTDRER
jgi:hypothetical protein